MSYIDAEGIPVAPLSMMDIEKKTTKYLEEYHPDFLKSPSALDVDAFLSVSLFKSHGFMPDLITTFENSRIYARAVMDKKHIQITCEGFNKLGADDGKARFDVCHEGSHVVLHSEQYEFFRLNPARMAMREHRIFEDAEWQAEHGGGAFLMPLDTLIPFIGSLQKAGCSLQSILYEIVDTYRISEKAARSRLNQFRKTGFSRFMAFSMKRYPDFNIQKLA
jgi:Zn-dependent peptidase ImmA (M78 family)